ncbi:MAG: hypothetical protein ACRDZW_08240 [Acidimicrobiales bacterium]
MPDPLVTLREATYTAVGLALMSFQRAQVHRRQLVRDVGTVTEQLRRRAASAHSAPTRH